MTNEQLKLLLMSMRAELSAVVQSVRERMPEDAERHQIERWEKKPEYKSRFVVLNSEETHNLVVDSGDYVALEPLVDLLARWQVRIAQLAENCQPND